MAGGGGYTHSSFLQSPVTVFRGFSWLASALGSSCNHRMCCFLMEAIIRTHASCLTISTLKPLSHLSSFLTLCLAEVIIWAKRKVFVRILLALIFYVAVCRRNGMFSTVNKGWSKKCWFYGHHWCVSQGGALLEFNKSKRCERLNLELAVPSNVRKAGWQSL